MAPRVIDCASVWPDVDAWREVLRALDADSAIAFPTETVYGIGVRADRPAAVERLRAIKTDRSEKPFALLVADATMALPHIGILPPVAARLMRLGWPGPLTLVLPARGGGTVGLRCPDHPVAAAVAALHVGGLASSSANRSGAAPPLTAGDVVEGLGPDVAVVLDAGPAPLRVASTVLRVDADGRCSVLREGAFPRDRIARAQYTQGLFVCSGNTCRSPMAAGLLRRRLAQALDVAESDLHEHGFVVRSAGTGAIGGGKATDHAITAARERGAEIRDHRSQPLSPELLEESDHVWCMSRSHLATVEEWLPRDRDRARLLDPASDVGDPVGGPLDEYRRCAGQIEAAVEAIAAQLLAQRAARADESDHPQLP